MKIEWAMMAAVLAGAVAFEAGADEVKMPRTYFIGNSLTDHFTADKRDYNPNGPAIVRICKEAGLPPWPNAGKNIAGAPLWWHWYHLKDGLRGVRDPEALAKEPWDIVTFQPHGGSLHFAGARDETTKGGVRIKAGALPDFDVRTPREAGVSDAWISLGTDPRETVGRSIHVNPLGQTILSYIFFSTLLARDGHGLDMRSLMNEPTKTEFSLSDEQLKIIQDTEWDVVKNHPRAGVKERPAEKP